MYILLTFLFFILLQLFENFVTFDVTQKCSIRINGFQFSIVHALIETHGKIKTNITAWKKWAIQTIFPERMTVFYVTHFGQSTHITNYAYIKICKCRYLRKLHSLRLHRKKLDYWINMSKNFLEIIGQLHRFIDISCSMLISII